ncbi:MAG: hypothetical protein ACOX8N_00860 [Christensenellales bacterium]|jgi:hypothetical protein
MLKKCFKITAVVAALILVVALAGCGGGTLKPPAMQEGATPVTVTGSCEMTIDGDTITVSGEIDVLPGSLVCVSVESQSGITLDSAVVTVEGKKISQQFKITEDKYDEGVVSVTGHITFSPRQYGTQPEEVYKKYGTRFENIKPDGKNVLWNSNGNIVVFASEMIDLK